MLLHKMSKTVFMHLSSIWNSICQLTKTFVAIDEFGI